MADPFSTYAPGLDSPASKGFAVTPSDADDLANVTRALYVGVAGDVVVILADDSASVTLKSASGFLPLRVKRVLATGTTATSIVGLY